MKQLTRKEKNVLKTIASFYGCKVEFIKERDDAYWAGDTITIGTGRNKYTSLSLFFHELGHFVNWKTGKYPAYHNRDTPKLIEKFASYKAFVRYALQAELYTDKVGKKLMKEWFPDFKYKGAYKKDMTHYMFLYGYFLRDAL